MHNTIFGFILVCGKMMPSNCLPYKIQNVRDFLLIIWGLVKLCCHQRHQTVKTSTMHMSCLIGSSIGTKLQRIVYFWKGQFTQRAGVSMVFWFKLITALWSVMINVKLDVVWYWSTAFYVGSLVANEHLKSRDSCCIPSVEWCV